MSIQEKFEKAVNVIRNLPKNGSYQPSHELQLRFYGYYKQATEGSNYHTRPSFWEVVKRAKWDAWAKLGNMPKEEAMIHYVEELRKIVETMSYTDNVANFLNSLDNFYEHVPPEDLEMLVGPIIEKIRSRPDSPLSGSPLASRDTSPSRASALSRDPSPMRLTANTVHNASKHITSSLETSPASSYSASPLPPDTDDEEGDEHFLDTQTEPDRGKDWSSKKNRDSLPSEEKGKEPPVSQELLHPLANGIHQGKRIAANISSTGVTLHVPETIHTTVLSIRKDMDQIKSRLQCVENTVQHQAKQLNSTKLEFCNDVTRIDQGPKTFGKGSSLGSSEAFKRAICSMTKEMENLQLRMATLENRRQQEIILSRKRSGTIIPKWWGLPLRTTAILLTWPILILLISKFVSNRRSH